MSLFFTSDHHIGHKNILKHCSETRPYATLEAMQAAYVEAWNDSVRPGDDVWYVGDLSLKYPPAAAFLQRVHGTKHLLVGNHDVCFKMHPQQIAQYKQAGFASVQRKASVQLGALTFGLCHFPYRVPEGRRSSDERTALRQAKFAPLSLVEGDLGEVALIHGHVHSFWRARVGVAQLPELNVAVDAWNGRPVTEAEVMALYRAAACRDEPGQMDRHGTWQPLHVADETAGYGAD